ncbi:DUF2953 domain-containing protein [Lederbergia sp. NSJ-179]|uniref:DUF2953 domain-containing protein n=1 Tax=Lederbergia sp. NSJ-179 TaxID=2931402 RepID=UPI001FD331BE|nr:DUF2953 domain-containing protein [Lederbergia sp. NSJ-179]MCJ7839718.1 DUF2953 domain-containing protein [Lederbergia sp. NSJ-179]
MQWLVVFILCFFIFIIIFIFVLLLTIQMSISTILSLSNIKIRIKASIFFGLLHFQKVFDLSDLLSIQIDETEDQDFKDLPSFLHDLANFPQNFKPFQKILARFLNKIKIKQFEWRTTIGLGDAADTGVASGAIWSLKGTLVSWVRNYLSFYQKPLLDVQPNYQQMTFESTCQCMMQIKVGNAIWTAYRLARQWKKYKKQQFSHTEKDRRTLNA